MQLHEIILGKDRMTNWPYHRAIAFQDLYEISNELQQIDLEEIHD